MIMDDLASKVTFSTDEAQNASIRTQIGALLFSLRDPDYRKANEAELKAMGVTLGSDFDQALGAADKYLRDAKAYEMYGQKGFQQNAMAEARKAKGQVIAKLSSIALRAAKANGAQMRAQAEGQGKLLDATRTRPTVGNGGDATETGGLLPPDVRANSAAANHILWQRTQGQRG